MVWICGDIWNLYAPCLEKRLVAWCDTMELQCDSRIDTYSKEHDTIQAQQNYLERSAHSPAKRASPLVFLRIVVAVMFCVYWQRKAKG